MSQPTPPSPPPPPGPPAGPSSPYGSPAYQPQPSTGGSSTAGWKVATALTAVMAVILAGTVYFFMDRRVSDLEDELAATQEQLAEAEASGNDPLGGLADLLGGLGGDGSGELGDLGDLLGLGDLGDLFGGGELDGIDPILFECLSPDLDLGLGGEGSIPDGDIESQVAAVREIVQEERGLSAEGDLDIEFVSRDEVQRRAVELTEAELDRDLAAVYGRLLATLGAVEPGIDLAQVQLDALEAGVGGFYNPETQELVIGSEELDGMGAYITAHEIVHALADAEFGLPDMTAMAETDGADAAYAALNAVEGDASLYGQQFISDHLPFDQLLALESESAESEAALAALPYIVRRELEFPYIDGMTFTCDLYLEGGWDAVDGTYVDLPTTSAQILFPDRYRAGEGAVEVSSVTAPGGWSEIHADTFGASDLLFLLEAPGGDEGLALDDPKERARAWAGGEITVWDRNGDTALAVVLGEHSEGPPLCDTVVEYYAAAFPDASQTGGDAETVFEDGSQAAVVSCGDGEVVLSIAPDAGTAREALP